MMWRCANLSQSFFRPRSGPNILCRRSLNGVLQKASTLSSSGKPGKRGELPVIFIRQSLLTRVVLPERYLLYHAGIGRIVLIGSMKLTAVFIFCYYAAVVAPWEYRLPESPAWMPIAGTVDQSDLFLSLLILFVVIVGSAIPMLVIMRATAPFVTFIHLKVPFYARRSKDHLARFVEKMPQHTEVDLTTIGHFGWPHVYRMPLFELRKAKFWFSAANMKRVPSSLSLNSKRPWWKGSLPTKFFVGKERVRRFEGSTLWQRVWEQLKTA